MASTIKEGTGIDAIEALISQELQWVEACTFNFIQRKKYRAVWLLLRDLVHASWSACYRSGVLELSMPRSESIHGESVQRTKDRLRNWLRESRLERLQTFEKFIRQMESESSTKHSVLQLVADGSELANRLKTCTDIHEVVKPRLQLVEENVRDGITNLRLQDIWRYFRLTWATPSETTPGRTMQYLIRDEAHPNHPIMGIISLENCAVQITDRDVEIGWNAPEFIETLKQGSSSNARASFLYLLQCVEDGVAGINFEDLPISASEVNHPSENTVSKLIFEAVEAEERRQEFLKEERDSDSIPDDEKSELGTISIGNEEALYRRKRAEQLARLLMAKMELQRIMADPDFDISWERFLSNERGYSAIRNALVAQKSKHIGSSMLELNVCGAIPPYNEILGGKLAALLALSPQVVADYKARYGNRESEIASRLKGSPVVRPADLVYIGTTSLYYVGSSQYNRLKLTRDILGTDYDILWKELGKTVGFGTLHITKSTTAALVEAAEHIGFTRINHVFGEGASPKLRLLNLSICELLESSQDDARDLAKHAMRRIVYGAFLAKNTREYLLGHDTAPEYYFSQSNVEEKTAAVIQYWQERWLSSRIKYEPIFERMRAFTSENLRVSTELTTIDEWVFKRLKEEETEQMQITESGRLGVDFVRNLYRGRSGYADKLKDEFLRAIHIETKLDDAVIAAIQSGNDVVLTGSPGDGKTHLIRVLADRIDALGVSPVIELDASCLSNEELYQKWHSAREESHPFVLAINAAVLFSLAEHYPDSAPIQDAWKQMTNAVVFDGATVPSTANVIVYDLSRREVLHKDIVVKAIEKVASDAFYTECQSCPNVASCPVQDCRQYMQNALFQERLCVLLSRVSLIGEHISLRELLSFLSYLIFAGRSCPKLIQTAGSDRYNIVSLIYERGQGQAFEYIRRSFDPAAITHPTWDELLLTASVKDNWVENHFIPVEAIDSTNTEQFDLRKRQFFFFNQDGNVLLDICDDDASRFQRFLSQEDKKSIRELIAKLNAFFGVKRTSPELDMWNGHRFNNSPRKVLVSAGTLKASQFSIGKPSLLPSMSQGISINVNYARLQRKDMPSVFLRVDFEMYRLLMETERGVPMLIIENDVTKRIWRFVEQLQKFGDEPDDELTITLLDVDEKREYVVQIDREENRYQSIEQHRTQI
jgi:hypothetical protein